jgi:hypothetical protein
MALNQKKGLARTHKKCLPSKANARKILTGRKHQMIPPFDKTMPMYKYSGNFKMISPLLFRKALLSMDTIHQPAELFTGPYCPGLQAISA